MLGQPGWRKRVGIRGGGGGRKEGGYKIYFSLSFVFFELKTSWIAVRPARQSNTWWTLSDGTIWCKSGFDSSHKIDWWHPASTGSSWQKNSTANQSSHESSWVWAWLIIISPLGQKPICLVFNTTKFPLSCWQIGSGHCLKSCNENNFLLTTSGVWIQPWKMQKE